MDSTEHVAIRPATIADVERIVRLANAGGPDNQPRQILPGVLPQEYFIAFKRISADPGQALMVAECNGIVVGTFHLTFLTYLAGAGREDCLIEAVHVDQAYRSKGIGSQMMKWAIETAKKRNCRRLQLTSDKKRQDAHRFYERLGFILSHEGAKLSL